MNFNVQGFKKREDETTNFSMKMEIIGSTGNFSGESRSARGGLIMGVAV